MNTIIKSIVFAAVVILQVSCTAQEDEKIQIMSEAYEPCCSIPDAVNLNIDGVQVFVPNVFTPNGDGVNDYFWPIFDMSHPSKPRALRFTIYNDSTSSRRIIWDAFSDIDYDNPTFSAFQGVNSQMSDLPREWRGTFFYSFDMYVNEKRTIVRGLACVVRCDDEAPIFQDKEGCFFPNQITPEYRGDNSLPRNEGGCFE